MSIRNMFVLLAVILSLVTVSSTWAKDCNVSVTGIIDELGPGKDAITVGETIVYGIPSIYLAHQDVFLTVGDAVEITAIQCNSTGLGLLEACTLLVDEDGEWVEVPLPGNRGL